MRIVLDARRLDRKGEAHTYLKEQLRFPEYYGNNLDALFDCLTDLDNTEVVFEHREAAGGYFQKILRVFNDAAKHNPGLVLAEKDKGGSEEKEG